MKRITINESQLNLMSEINHLAEKSNVTICSLEDFKSLVSSMGINDGNVEQYAGQYCFIEIGSSYPRIYTEKDFSTVNIVNDQEFSPKDFYKVQQVRLELSAKCFIHQFKSLFSRNRGL